MTQIDEIMKALHTLRTTAPYRQSNYAVKYEDDEIIRAAIEPLLASAEPGALTDEQLSVMAELYDDAVLEKWPSKRFIKHLSMCPCFAQRRADPALKRLTLALREEPQAVPVATDKAVVSVGDPLVCEAISTYRETTNNEPCVVKGIEAVIAVARRGWVRKGSTFSIWEIEKVVDDIWQKKKWDAFAGLKFLAALNDALTTPPAPTPQEQPTAQERVLEILNSHKFIITDRREVAAEIDAVYVDKESK